MKIFTILSAFGVLLALVFSSCEKERSEAVDPPLASPYVLSSRVSTPFINLDTSSSSALVRLQNGKYDIRDSLIAQLTDPNGVDDVLQVIFHLYGPAAPDYFASGNMALDKKNGDTASYIATFSFTISRPEVGEYRVEVLARNKTNLVSNSVQSSITVTRMNSAPRLSNLFTPDTVRRPSSGYRLVFLAVSATDSDGATDVAEVFFKNVSSSNPDLEIQLYDDGNLSVTGDSVAYDGRYSRTLAIDSTAALRTNEFRFWARDKAGALSDSLVHFVTVIPE